MKSRALTPFVPSVLAIGLVACAAPAPPPAETLDPAPSESSESDASGDIPEDSATSTTGGPDPSATASATTTTGAVPTDESSTETTVAESEVSSETSAIDPIEPFSFALRVGDIPEPDIESEVSTSDAGDPGQGQDPDALRVFITNDPLTTCEAPFLSSKCGTWHISFTLPPALQVPGTYALFPDLDAVAFGTAVEEEFGCGGGGGSLEGTLVLEIIDDTHLVGHIEDGSPIFFDTNVAFDAPRCGI